LSPAEINGEPDRLPNTIAPTMDRQLSRTACVTKQQYMYIEKENNGKTYPYKKNVDIFERDIYGNKQTNERLVANWL